MSERCFWPTTSEKICELAATSKVATATGVRGRRADNLVRDDVHGLPSKAACRRRHDARRELCERTESPASRKTRLVRTSAAAERRKRRLRDLCEEALNSAWVDRRWQVLGTSFSLRRGSKPDRSVCRTRHGVQLRLYTAGDHGPHLVRGLGTRRADYCHRCGEVCTRYGVCIGDGHWSARRTRGRRRHGRRSGNGNRRERGQQIDGA